MQNQIESAGAKEAVSRKQFLVLAGSFISALFLSQFFFIKKTQAADNSYGNNTYGTKKQP